MTVAGATYWGARATDPPIGDSSDGDSYYNTVIKEQMVFLGAPRNRWLSQVPIFIQCGTFANASGGTFLFAPVFSSMSLVKGIPVPRAALISVRINKSNSTAVDLGIFVAGSQVHLASMTSATLDDTTVNADVNAGVCAV